MTTTITIPAPCAWLNSNDRRHRMAEAKLVKEWRESAYSAAVGIEPFTEQVHITAHIWKPRAGRYDAGNLYPTAKACVDGLVDRGILADDSNRFVVGPDMRHGGKGPAALVLTILPNVRSVITP